MTSKVYVEDVESEAETCASDDSQDDPTFDILEETQSRFSNLSIKKKSESRTPMKLDDDVDCTEIPQPEFDANEQKCYEIVQKIIEVGHVEKLKVDQCKLYLRKHGLRLTGKKDVLIDRIKEHISIMNGEGEHKYPASSFVMNCKGDACTGDIVMFEQNVYEMFSIASRSATGPPCGTRVVAGRIVKESYGAAKQQHTFTVEVLWSKGEKPLPTLHPLLIKGRNLYRLKTMRQRWEDESERQKILCEKHARGNEARNNREVRIQEKEKKKALRENRVLKVNIPNENQEKKRKTSPTNPMINSRNSIKHDFQKTSSQHEAKNLPTSAQFPRVIMNNNNNNNYQRDSYKENVNSYQGGQNMDLHSSRRFEQTTNVYQHTMSHHQQRENAYHPLIPSRSDNFQHGGHNGYLPRGQCQGWRTQPCKYYAQGRCTYGTNCKFFALSVCDGYMIFASDYDADFCLNSEHL